mmetsp:Transcript_25675/g.53602  ORF Transcript_25675/g.53602 Transcript_25675/m.53602 type:complete len:208 (-) Transcript_25675:983-1606(-)
MDYHKSCNILLHLLFHNSTKIRRILPHKRLVQVINDRHRQQYPCPRPNRSHVIRHHRQKPYANTAQRRRDGDVTSQNPRRGRIPMTLHHHLILPHLTRHIPHRRPANLRPSPSEDGAGGERKHQVKQRVERIVKHIRQCRGGRNVVRQSSHGNRVRHRGGAGGGDGPLPEEFDEGRVRLLVVQHLGDEVDVGDEGGLEDDGHVGGVE